MSIVQKIAIAVNGEMQLQDVPVYQYRLSIYEIKDKITATIAEYRLNKDSMVLDDYGRVSKEINMDLDYDFCKFYDILDEYNLMCANGMQDEKVMSSFWSHPFLFSHTLTEQLHYINNFRVEYMYLMKILNLDFYNQCNILNFEKIIRNNNSNLKYEISPLFERKEKKNKEIKICVQTIEKTIDERF